MCVRATPALSVVMGRLRLVGSLKLYVSFAKEHYKRDLYSLKRCILLIAHSYRVVFSAATIATALYGVATISRLLKIIGLFCRISFLLLGFFCTIDL